MTPRTPAPGQVLDAAVRVYVRNATDVDRAALRAWAALRYPDRRPDGDEELAFWVIEAAHECGVARVTPG